MNMFKSTKAQTPSEYLTMIEDPQRKAQVEELFSLIRKWVPKLKPHIQSGMIGFGSYHYKTKAGVEGDWFQVGLASQKNYISIYACGADIEHGYVAEKYKARLPKADIGKSCIRIKRVDDIDLEVLKRVIQETEEIFKRRGDEAE